MTQPFNDQPPPRRQLVERDPTRWRDLWRPDDGHGGQQKQQQQQQHTRGWRHSAGRPFADLRRRGAVRGGVVGVYPLRANDLCHAM
eukprot:COSAG02_NODE_1858_length_10636_cov_6.878333_8_plen_86_part_00